MRVATFNAYNLNAENVEFVGRSDTLPYNSQGYSDKIADLSAILTAAAPDIAGFQEIFAESALKDLVAASSMAGSAVYAPLATIESLPDGKRVGQGPNVALVTRFPIKQAQTIENFPEEMQVLVPTGLHGLTGEVHQIAIRRFERPVLQAELVVPGLPGLTVFVAHLKSKRPKFLPGEDVKNEVVKTLGALRSLIVRAAEAAALRTLILRARNEWVDGRRRPVIVLGDVNDDLGSVTTEMLVGQRPFANSDGSISRFDYHYRTRELMLSAFELIALDPLRAYSHVYDGKGSILDMVLLSADFWGRGGEARARVRDARIINDHLPSPLPVFAVPEPESYTVPANPKPPKDPLAEAAPRDKRNPPKPGLDHGVPVVEIEVF